MADTSESLTRDHWYWRPGWRPGRRFYTWHVTEFVTERPIVEIANSYAPMLTATGILDLIPTRWLHLTVQGVEFADNISDSEAAAIVAAARPLLADVEPAVATLGPIDMDEEAAFLPFRPVDQLEVVRTQLRTAIAHVRGADQVPEPAQFGWPPHVSLGYVNTTGEPLTPIRDALRQDARTWTVTIREISLIKLERDHGFYQWTTIDRPVRTGKPGPDNYRPTHPGQ